MSPHAAARHPRSSSWTNGSALAALIALLATAPAAAQTIVHYDFDQTGTTVTSDGSSAVPLTLRNSAGAPTDLHSANARGVSGQASDRSFQNTAASDHGSAASAATNGSRADQADNNALDGLTAFTISGWLKTGDWTTVSGKTPRLVENHDGSNGFNLQFLTGSNGDLKLEVDSTSTPAPVEASSGTSGLYSAKSTWIFFAVRYDGASTSGNVEFYRGFRNDVEAQEHGAASADVTLVASGNLGCSTCTLVRGAVNDDTSGLTIGNRDELGRPFDGFLDDIRIDAGLTGFEALENYRLGAISTDPIEVEWRSTTTVPTTVQDQNNNTFTVNEISGIAYDRTSGNFWGVSDKNGRLIELDINFNASGAIVGATGISGLVLEDTSDYESIALPADGLTVFVSDESTPPKIREYDMFNGSLHRALPIPTIFNSARANLRFESLSRNFEDTEMISAVQQALTVDGPAGTSTTIPTVVRMLRHQVNGTDTTTNEEYAYVVEPLHATPMAGDGSSLSEIEHLPDGRLLAIERSEAEGETLVRIFAIETLGATDVSVGATENGLIGQVYTPVEKTLVLSAVFGKLEGFSVGPTLPDGRLSAVAVEDNSGSGPNVLHSFAIDVPEPGLGALLSSGVLSLALCHAATRRRGGRR